MVTTRMDIIDKVLIEMDMTEMATILGVLIKREFIEILKRNLIMMDMIKMVSAEMDLTKMG